MNFAKLLLYLAIFIHVLSCFFHLVTFNNKDRVEILESETGDEFEVVMSMQWYAPADWIDFTKSRIFTGDMGFLETYLYFYYYGILTLGINELGPVNPSEMAFTGISLFVCMMLTNFLFSDMAVIASFLQ